MRVQGGNVVLLHRAVPQGRPALFLDRDGVVIVDSGYPDNPANVRLLPGAAAAIARCNTIGRPVVLVSNQSGLGRGYFTQATMLAVQQRVDELLADEGAVLDAVFLCGAHPDAADALAQWRKPNPGMLLAAAALLGVNLPPSTLVGDKRSDLEAAAAAGLHAGYKIEDGLAGDAPPRPWADGPAGIISRQVPSLAIAVAELLPE